MLISGCFDKNNKYIILCEVTEVLTSGLLSQEEKLELQKLLERVPIPVKESIEEPSAKVPLPTARPGSGLKDKTLTHPHPLLQNTSPCL